MKGQPKTSKHEFRVTIGVDLPPETVKRIARAVQKSVLVELASADLSEQLSIRFLGEGQSSAEGENGPTQGAQIIAERG